MKVDMATAGISLGFRLPEQVRMDLRLCTEQWSLRGQGQARVKETKTAAEEARR